MFPIRYLILIDKLIRYSNLISIKYIYTYYNIKQFNVTNLRKPKAIIHCLKARETRKLKWRLYNIKSREYLK
jgi:hypothetical protein